MNTAVATKEPNPLLKLHEQLEVRASQFQAALPAHIPVERFKRVILTAVQMNPALASADRQTLWNSAMRAAQDGLLPDGREGAMVIYKTKIKTNGAEHWVDAVQWMPMIAGIRKKVRNSGEIATWDAHVVHEKDEFTFELGDEPYIKHKPFMGGDRGKVIAAYSVATLKNGEKSREVMSVQQIEKVRAISRAKDKGPWVDWYEEMCRKTVARRHSKVLPMSTDLDDLMRRDDGLYDFEGAKGDDKPPRPSLADFATAPVAIPEQKAVAAPAETVDTETGEITTGQQQSEYSAADAMAAGVAQREANLPRRSPTEWDQDASAEPLRAAWLAGWDETDAEIAQAAKAGKGK